MSFVLPASHRTSSTLLVAAALLTAFPIHAQQAATSFRKAEITPLKLGSGITMQPDYQDGVIRQVLTGLQQSQRFDQVITLNPTETPAPARNSVRVTATVTQYSAGSAKKRALIGFGAGATKLTVHLVFTDALTGKLLTEGDAHGAVKAGSLLGGAGNNEDAQKAIAGEVKHLADGLTP